MRRARAAMLAGCAFLALLVLVASPSAASGADVERAREALTELEEASDGLYEAFRAQLEEAERWPPRGSEEDAWLDAERIEEAGDELAERYRDDDEFEGIGNELVRTGQAIDRLTWIARLVRLDDRTAAALARVAAARGALDRLFAAAIERARDQRDVWIARRLTGSQERRLDDALAEITAELPALDPFAAERAGIGTPVEAWERAREGVAEAAPDEATSRTAGAEDDEREEGVSGAQELTEAEPARVVRPGRGEMDVPIRDEARARREDSRLREEIARFLLVARDVASRPDEASDESVARFKARILMRIARDLDGRIRGAGARPDDELHDAWRRVLPPLREVARIHKLEPPGP